MSNRSLDLYHPMVSDDKTLTFADSVIRPWKHFIAKISERNEVAAWSLRYEKCTQHYNRENSGIMVVKYAELISANQPLFFDTAQLLAKYRCAYTTSLNYLELT